MKVFVAGSNGQLARALVDLARAAGVEMLALGRPEFDLERQKGAERLTAFAPDAIINAAAYTAVDAAESDSARAFAVNRDGAAWLAGLAAGCGVPFAHVSTDFVFDGRKNESYVEEDAPNPLSVYGRSKRAGEEAVLSTYPAALVFRTAWVFSPYGHNFVTTMLRLASERDQLRVVNDQRGNPTSAHDIAAGLLAVLKRSVQGENHLAGVYHLAASGEATWFGFAQEIMRLAGGLGQRTVPIVPITTAEYPTLANRPANSRLCCDKLDRDFGLHLPCWRGSLAKTIQTLLADANEKPG